MSAKTDFFVTLLICLTIVGLTYTILGIGLPWGLLNLVQAGVFVCFWLISFFPDKPFTYVVHFSKNVGDFGKPGSWLVVSRDDRECFHGSEEVAKWVRRRKVPIMGGVGRYEDFIKEKGLTDHKIWPLRNMELRLEELSRSAKSPESQQT